MCGRYTQTKLEALLRKRFRFEPGELLVVPRFNIAPMQEALVVVGGETRALRIFRWGLVPSWAKEESIGNRMINARAETLAEKPSFRRALERRRCLVLADGFYEWKKSPDGKTKTPMRITLKGEEPFAFAGLFETWKRPDATFLTTFTIVTTAANEVLKEIHDRMPVILREEDEGPWLDPSLTDGARLAPLLRPAEPDIFVAYPVSALVNSPRNDVEACIRPAS